MSVFSNFGITQETLTTLAILYSILLFIGVFFALFLFFLKGYGIYKIFRKLGAKGSWRGFVPFLWVNAVCDLISIRKKKAIKNITLFSYYLTYALDIVSFLFSIAAITKLWFEADIAMAEGLALDPIVFSSFKLPALFIIFTLVSLLVFKVSLAFACNEIFKIFCSNYAVVFSVVSFVLPLTLPFFMYYACKREPEFCTDNEEEIEIGFTI